MAEPLFSVIVPTYARPEFLAAAIQSLFAQTIEDFECIVVDDASPVPVSVAADPRIRLVRRSENGGPAAARNTGLTLARGRFVTFLDDDDLYTTDRLALALEGLARAPLSICWVKHLNAPPRFNGILQGRVQDTALESWPPHLGSVSIERTILQSFDERFIAVEDSEWWLRMVHVAPVRTVPRFGYVWRYHPAPRHLVNLPARIDGRLLLLRTHGTYFAAHPRAAAFQWKRIGHLARMLGDYALARAAFRRALSLRSEVKTLWFLTCSCWFSNSERKDASRPIIWGE